MTPRADQRLHAFGTVVLAAAWLHSFAGCTSSAESATDASSLPAPEDSGRNGPGNDATVPNASDAQVDGSVTACSGCDLPHQLLLLPRTV